MSYRQRWTWIPGLILVFGLTASVAAQDTAGHPAVVSPHAEVRSAVDRLARSALWRQALDNVAALGRTILVVTPDQVVVRDEANAGSAQAFDASSLAEASPHVQADGRIETVLVVVNLPLLRQEHERSGGTNLHYAADLERILIHEIYGHAVPWLLAGSLAGRCADPVAGDDPTTACSIVRENAVRVEAGLGVRPDYTVSGLTLGRGRPATR